MQFKIKSPYRPTGDQPEAIKEICEAVNAGADAVTLLGVTGSGKTFTMANVIEKLQRPALILSHNKTLAAQLYGEFKSFFPDNAVEYFVSYYDYYQPEAYLPVTDTYIEKDLSINDEIEKLRLSASSALLSGRRDVIVISSVSCLYGIGDNTIILRSGMRISRNKLLYRLVDALYNRNDVDFKRGTFRVKGDTIDIYLAYADTGCRIVFFGDTIEELELIDPLTGMTIESPEEVIIYPANIFVTTKERTAQAIRMIQDDMMQQCEYFSSIGKQHEANRLKKRVEYDMEMIKELGYCPGIENYSRYFDGRSAGQRPFCLIDYFPKDFITFIDESHVTLPQVRAMYGGDRSRKEVLIEPDSGTGGAPHRPAGSSDRCAPVQEPDRRPDGGNRAAHREGRARAGHHPHQENGRGAGEILDKTAGALPIHPLGRGHFGKGGDYRGLQGRKVRCAGGSQPVA